MYSAAHTGRANTCEVLCTNNCFNFKGSLLRRRQKHKMGRCQAIHEMLRPQQQTSWMRLTKLFYDQDTCRWPGHYMKYSTDQCRVCPLHQMCHKQHSISQAGKSDHSVWFKFVLTKSQWVCVLSSWLDNSSSDPAVWHSSIDKCMLVWFCQVGFAADYFLSASNSQDNPSAKNWDPAWGMKTKF